MLLNVNTNVDSVIESSFALMKFMEVLMNVYLPYSYNCWRKWMYILRKWTVKGVKRAGTSLSKIFKSLQENDDEVRAANTSLSRTLVNCLSIASTDIITRWNALLSFMQKKKEPSPRHLVATVSTDCPLVLVLRLRISNEPCQLSWKVFTRWSAGWRTSLSMVGIKWNMMYVSGSVLFCLQEASLTLNVQKCEFSQGKIKSLGHSVDAQGVHADPEKTRATAQFPVPSITTELQRWARLTSWESSFQDWLA